MVHEYKKKIMIYLPTNLIYDICHSYNFIIFKLTHSLLLYNLYTYIIKGIEKTIFIIFSLKISKYGNYLYVRIESFFTIECIRIIKLWIMINLL